jgi:hypothetical protein
LKAGVHPQTGQPTTFARFGSGDVYSWNAGGVQYMTGWKPYLTYTAAVATDGATRGRGTVTALDPQGRYVPMIVSGEGGVHAMENNATAPDNDLISGNSGYDTIYGGAGGDVIRGGIGRDWLLGQDGIDNIQGDGHGDSLDGGAGDDLLFGGAGEDTLVGQAGGDALYGGTENDRLYGGLYESNAYTYVDGTNRLYGEDGDDFLSGGNARDSMYGGANTDRLYGNGGDDWMDAGAAGEVSVGGDGYDLNAWVPVVRGAAAHDIDQGASNSCWLVAAISAASLREVDFASRIAYLGNGTYSVGLYSTSGVWTTQLVTFNGDRVAADADFNKDPEQEGEFWVTLVQRAYLTNRGMLIGSIGNGNSADPLRAFTGRASSTIATNDLNALRNALNANKNVIAGTWDPLPATGGPTGSARGVSTNMLVTDHAYTVVRLETLGNQTFVVMRNPQGVDNGATTWGNPNDGEVRVSWDDFSRSMESIVVN